MKKRIVRMISVLLFVSLIACEDIFISPLPQQEENQYITHYLIEKGAHDANQLPSLKEKISELKFQAKFDSTAIYTSQKANNQADINKLYGLSDCNSLHQVNSARFGWRWYNGQLQILAYTYNNKVRDFKIIGTASINAYHQYKIEFTATSYIFTLDNNTVTLPRNCSGKASGYKLYPYFGGDEVAPHDVSIWIKDL
ncbi:hypothetical protein [Chryseolinea sp. H1M3-3]|uniref:hypothetical protein n=1 Tax=Chryseolinea sp. H1M3-3 TaxID=3034144 RepID=UPI0023ED3B74|nr:hypothetical protein [Chryseolinea sp. H1M3-3]